jgi:cob(I)alamin adenosyltransferase
MVRLTRIYTKTGDKGTTALGDGRRVPKDAPRIEAFGTVDELNAVLGLALLGLDDADEAAILRRIQNDLFDLGADLCLPERSTRARAARARPPLRLTPAHVRPLEEAIDRFNAPLGALTSFVLPGGTAASSWLHLARTVCRRAERRVVALARVETINPQTIIYLNRLSDLLFVMARRANDGGRSDVLWRPGGA